MSQKYHCQSFYTSSDLSVDITSDGSLGMSSGGSSDMSLGGSPDRSFVGASDLSLEVAKGLCKTLNTEAGSEDKKWGLLRYS